jgi:hypothetical protein
VDFAQAGPATWGGVHILDDRNSRQWQTADGLPPIRPIQIRLARNRWIRRTDPTGGCIAQEASVFLRDATQSWPRKSFIPQPYAELLNCICDHTRIELLDSFKLARGEHD